MKCSVCSKEISNYVNKCKHCNSTITPDYELLVDLAINNDKKAKEALYVFTNKAVYFVALKMVKNENDAMDIVQDSYMKAYAKLSSISNPKQFPSWINQITANLCRDYFKKKQPDFLEDFNKNEDDEMEFQIEDEDGIIPEELIENKDVQNILRDIINNLPEEQRLCVLMYYFDNMSISEIAISLDVSEGTVKSRLNYARKKMKAEIENLSKKGIDLRGISIGWLFRWSFNIEKDSTNIPKGLLTIKTGATATASSSLLTTKTLAGITAGIIALGGAGSGVYYVLTNNAEKNSATVVSTVSSNFETNVISDVDSDVISDVDSDTENRYVVNEATEVKDPSEFEYKLYKKDDTEFNVLARIPEERTMYIVDKYTVPDFDKDNWAKENFGYETFDDLLNDLPTTVSYKPEYGEILKDII